MSVAAFINRLKGTPDEVSFDETMALIERYFDYTPTRFTNGVGESRVVNEAGSNEGSCKIFALGKQLALNESETLNCFGDYYRVDVKQHPGGRDHANIRNFITYGWRGIEFDHVALQPKES